PHQAQLTVHPAYTWLYPKLLAQMAQSVKNLSSQSLELISADYQHEREEFLEKLGAQRIGHALLMSRSVWHKLKEIKPEGLQLSEVLQSLQPVPRTPIPSRISWLKLPFNSSSSTSNLSDSFDSKTSTNSLKPASENGKNASELLEKSDNVNPE
ncbi:MAG: GNAT family N-acetyltransferase, partial [Hydrococcus sp. RM1_1_31]|nr:GNAT family N-acetyltransferase [Hydrococcus sp. RM1_1_31]